MSEIHSVNDLASCVFNALVCNPKKSHYELFIARVPGHLFWASSGNIWLIDLASEKPDAIAIRCDLFDGPARKLVIDWLTKPAIDRELSKAGSLFSITHDEWARDWIGWTYSPHKDEGPYLFDGEWMFQHAGEMDNHYCSVSDAIEYLIESELGAKTTEADMDLDIPFNK